MTLIKPNEVASTIMSLMDEAEEKFVIVSPYSRIDGWQKLKNHIKRLRERDIDVEWFIRKREDNDTVAAIQAIGINPVEVEDLNARVYFNEMRAIITSMNLHQAADDGLLDLAHITDTDDEYTTIIEFYNTYLKMHVASKPLIIEYSNTKRLIDFAYERILGAADKDVATEKLKRERNLLECSDVLVPGLGLEIHDRSGDVTLTYRLCDGSISRELRDLLFTYLHVKREEIERQVGCSIDWWPKRHQARIDLSEVDTGHDGIGTHEQVRLVLDLLEKSLNVIGGELLSFVTAVGIQTDTTTPLVLPASNWPFSSVLR